MTGAEHAAEAERLLHAIASRSTDGPAYYTGLPSAQIAAAQVHALLALAAACERAATPSYTIQGSPAFYTSTASGLPSEPKE